MKILRYPNPDLRRRSLPVEAFDADLRQAVADMTTTMTASRGAGLAAIQVGIPVRLFIVVGPTAGGRTIVFANPEIVEASSETETRDEGCLSFPNIFVPIKRSATVKVRAKDINDVSFEIEAHGFFARALQHEIDHLDGKLLVDHVGPVKRDIIKRKLRKNTRDSTREQEKTT